jgi:RHS repeat-associated protein
MTTSAVSAPNVTFFQHHFTGKERDSESGLDYSTYRMYASTMGRWTSPDPGWFLAVHKGDSQTWNMYAYVGNNPLRYTDPFGLSKDCGGGGDPSLVCIATTAWDWLKNAFGGSTTGGNGSSGGSGSGGGGTIPDAGNYFLRPNYDTGANSQNVREIQYQLYNRTTNQAVNHKSHPNSDLFIFETQTAPMGGLDKVGDFFANTHENNEAFTFTDQVGGRCFLWCDTVSSTQNFYLQSSSSGFDPSRRYPLSVEAGGNTYTSLQIKIKQMGLFTPGSVLIQGMPRWSGVPSAPPNP